ncbi:BZ3500_MvSof-1268-A1-R1_Chr8-2g10186 [Microbotryum saponariae]|uniref:BZ3500_MvSof-1268-A1-R1_Chr8-2g10186 protein n=1 Tax=Microbotryum saponariae TaxID=289078 RepID=A0A2X0L8K4_9BASI|nr:BZ3500_MvSof-1268-A1-R1_Chr8-2g10186 [Microbotryum saponariae]SDA01959.1 BZ3501_MvSof-1269-A2-R1_Chr8-2g09936 [Microbotryum saponariae]
MTSRTTKRLLSELNDFANSQQSASSGLISLGPRSDSSLLDWTATIQGPPDSAYQDRTFVLAIKIPETYPAHPPTISFPEPVFHPNVHLKLTAAPTCPSPPHALTPSPNSQTGEICLDVLKTEWSPVWTLTSACLAVQALLAVPEPSSPLNVDAANLLRSGDQVAYSSMARMYVLFIRGHLFGDHWREVPSG